MKSNIILIGMPGVGKSTIGQILAPCLNYNYIDTDNLIEKEIGMPLSAYIYSKGIEEFKEVETQILLKISTNKSVVSTGGSVVYEMDAMIHLKSLGLIIYLENDFATIEKRILAAPDRGLVMSKNQTLKDLYLERIKLYEKYSELTIECNNLNPFETSQKIVEQLKLTNYSK